MDKVYISKAKKEMKKVFEELGHSPTAKEWPKSADKLYSLARLKTHDLTLNKLKIMARVPLNKNGFGKDSNKVDQGAQKSIFCESIKDYIKRSHCVPGYRPAKCNECKSIQHKNITAIPSLTEEEEMKERYTTALGNKSSAEDDVYLTDMCII